MRSGISDEGPTRRTSSGGPSLARVLVTACAVACWVPAPAGAEASLQSWEPLEILGETIGAGTKRTLNLVTSESFAGNRVETPVIVMRGAEPGPTLCLVAGVHGDEVNGIEIVRRVVHDEHRVDRLRGTILAVPIANISAFRRGSRYLPDRRDLNRHFPGKPNGSSASRIAHRIFDGVIRHCNAVVDFHTGSFHRTNLHQVRARLKVKQVEALAQAYGAAVIVNNDGRAGTLRGASVDEGIPAITVEAGEPARFDAAMVDRAARAVSRLVSNLGMTSGAELWPEQRAPELYRYTRWVRSDHGGILVSSIELGASVDEGALLGTVSDPVSGDVVPIRAPFAGRLIGMALDQLVMPGFAAYHLASREADRDEPEAESLDPEDLDDVGGRPE